jgi:hypothetical protein
MDSHPECAACAPKLHSWQEKEKFEYAGAAGGYLDKFGYPLCRGRVLKELETDYGQYDSPKNVFWATGACLLVRSSVYKELGGLDDRFFAHMEEIDLCWRMQLCGWTVTVVPNSVVYHVGGGTLPATSPFKLFLNFRNNRLMLSNNLAKTFANQFIHEGMAVGIAARKGYYKAKRRLFLRGILDMLSAFVYLATGKIDCFKSVLKARKEAKALERKGEEKAYLKDKIQRVSLLQRSITQREQMITSLTAYVVQRQENFFQRGEGNLTSLRMQDAADILKVHVSTISRAVNGKYLQCEWGIYPLKYFFTQGKEDGPVRTDLRKLIRQMIREENKEQPLSDSMIERKLKEKGIEIARRTVAKYRKAEGIPDVYKRKIN